MAEASTVSNSSASNSAGTKTVSPKGRTVAFSVPAVFSKCLIASESPSEGAIVMVHIPPEILRRLRTRCQTTDLASYLWDNILLQALSSHVY